MLLSSFVILLLVSSLEASPSGPHAVACQRAVSHVGYRPGAKHRKHQVRVRAAASDDACLNSQPLSPIMGIKRAMELNNLELFRLRRSRLFSLEKTGVSDAERKRYLAQIPNYAVQHGANFIWNSLGLDPSDPHFDFLIHKSKNLWGVYIDSETFTQREDGLPFYTYDYHEQWLSENLNSDRKLSEIVGESLTRDTFIERYVTRVKKTESEPGKKGVLHFLGSFFSAPAPSTLSNSKPLTIFDIAENLEIEYQETRQHNLRVLREKIEAVSTEGDILDDIIGSSNFMFRLVWTYLEDPGTTKFIRFLLKEGAPVSEKNIFRFYTHFKNQDTTTPEDLVKYKKIARLIVEYASESAEASLAHILNTYHASSRDPSIPSIVEAYEAIFPEMNFSDPLLLQALGHYLSMANKDDYFRIAYQAIDVFAKHGIVPLDVDKAFWKFEAENLKQEDEGLVKEGLAGVAARLAEKRS